MEQSKVVDNILAVFRDSGFQTPSVKETIDIIGEDLFWYLVQSGIFTLISQSVVFLSDQIDVMISMTENLFEQRNKITVADFRDYFNTSRKYAVAMLEYLDEQKITLREGDFRIRNSG